MNKNFNKIPKNKVFQNYKLIINKKTLCKVFPYIKIPNQIKMSKIVMFLQI